MHTKIRKVLSSVGGLLVLIIGVTFLSFSLLYLAPGDPAETILRSGGTMPSEAAILEKRHEMGLDRPFLTQYVSWLSDCARGDLGVSMIDGTNVTKRLLNALKSSFLLSVLSLLFGVAIALPIGVLTAVQKDKLFDKLTCFLVFIRLSMPSFLVSIGLMYIFSYRMKLLPITSSSAGAKGLILPIATLASGICVRMIRQIRSIVTSQLKNSYVDGLRSRGIKETSILFRHVLKNCMLPVVTLIALSFGTLLGGTAITEKIFSYPGIGQLALEGIGNRDYTIVQGFVVVIALIFCVIYGFTELSYGIFDPRVRSSKGAKS